METKLTQSSTDKTHWVVHKFGGTSVENADRYSAVAQIIQENQKRQPHAQTAIVVSAMKRVTDDLIALTQLACKKDPHLGEAIEKLRIRHLEAFKALELNSLTADFESDLQKIREILQGVSLVQSVSESIVEFISGHGEIWSAQILAGLLNKNGIPTAYLDARKVLKVEQTAKTVLVQWKGSEKKLAEWLKLNTQKTLVITGFIATSQEGIPTTLKRNGSDFSATIFARLLSATEVTIWTDVDGVLSADPRLVPDAKILNEMTYNEVTELANFGAKVIHPATMEPAIHMGIPVWIKNTFNPTFKGTLIHPDAKSTSTVKGFSAIENMALINIEGTGLVGVPGVSGRLFGALSLAEISVVMISQASSEHSICIAVSQDQAVLAKTAIEKAFFAEIQQGALSQIEIKSQKSILAAVGDNMVARPGVAGQFFSALAHVGVSIEAIAQGASERNISAVIDGKKTKQALRAVHSSFYLSNRTVGVGIVGTGQISKELLRQIQKQTEILKNHHGIEIRVRAITNSQRMLLDDADKNNGLSPSELQGFLESPKLLGEAVNLDRFKGHLQSSYLPISAIIDLTASDEISGKYSNWLRAGLHVISANKKSNAHSLLLYREVREAAKLSRRRFMYSAHVGAGMPIIRTLHDLHLAGDTLIAIEGVLSGTLSYIFNHFDGSHDFSKAILEAKNLGFTEPDPREDLSGMDVARKILILAREAEMSLELKDIHVENLVSPTLQKLSLAEYLIRMGEDDARMSARVKEARSKNQVLRYVGKIQKNGGASVELMSLEKNHPFSNLKQADNSVSIHTQNYADRPLIIQGPGAGPKVTATGVLSDLLRLVELGHNP